jgi:hypothetical protein
MLQDAMHLRHFKTQNPAEVLRLREVGRGLFYLEDLSEMEATFTLQGFVIQALICPSNERFG